MQAIREFTEYQAHEADQLRAIRRHRNRRRIWRHNIRVRKARATILGLCMILASVALVVVDPLHDATFALLTIPTGAYLAGKRISGGKRYGKTD